MKKSVKVAYDAMKNKILACQYQPEQLVSEKEIVEELNISRTPVREAISILKGEGLIKIISNKGIQISPLSVKKIKEIYDVRMILEPLAVRQAIKYISSNDIEHLLELNKKLNDYINKEDMPSIFGIIMDIHLFISYLSNNETLFSLIKMLRDESHRACVYYLQSVFDDYYFENKKATKKDILDSIQDKHNKFIKFMIEKDEESTILYIIDELNYLKNLFTEF